MAKLRTAGQSIIEYTILLVIVAVASVAFTVKFIKSGELKLFSGYVANVTGAMR